MTKSDCALILVRHTEVAVRYRGVCYGRSDVGLSPRGIEQCNSLADQLAKLNPTIVCHSNLKRTRILADLLTKQSGAALNRCDALRERDFGSWELRLWDDIYASANGDIDRLVTQPAFFRPPGGETTFELRDRVVHWFQSLPRDGLVVAITHGGPIAALCGYLDGLAVEDWASRIPATGGRVHISRDVGQVVSPKNGSPAASDQPGC